jgi:hypothetical protein
MADRQPTSAQDLTEGLAAAGAALDLDWIRAEWQTAAPLDDPSFLRFEQLLANRQSA